MSHFLDKPLDYYQQAWETACSLPGWAPKLTNSSLPTPMMMQIRSAVVSAQVAANYISAFLPEAPVKDTSIGNCRMIEMTAATAPFADQRHIKNYSLPLRWVQRNAREEAGAYGWADWTNWSHRLHSEYVGEGWGYGVSELCV